MPAGVMNRTVSVVLPCFNAHTYLGETLASVRAQTFTDLEIIVVDDGSTDPATQAYLSTLPADIRLVRQENRGLAGARNAGFRAARGRYVLPLDCDDLIAPTMIAHCVEALERAGADYAHAQIEVFGDQQGIVRKQANFFEQLATNQLPYCMLIRRDAWEQAGGYDEGMRLGYEDWEFNIRLGAIGFTGVAVPEPLFRYRVRSAGMLRSLSQRHHATIWRHIRARHRDVYSWRGLVRTWWQWRDRPATHPLSATWMLLILGCLLPGAVYNRLFFLLHDLGKSRREA